MLILGFIAGGFGLCLLCWLLFNLAVFALPFFTGVSTGLAALHAGSGAIGAIGVGLTVGVVVLAAGQAVFTFAPSMLARSVTAALFAIPAAFAGYHGAHGLAEIAALPQGLRHVVGIVGSLVIATTALTRLTLGEGRRDQRGS